MFFYYVDDRLLHVGVPMVGPHFLCMFLYCIVFFSVGRHDCLSSFGSLAGGVVLSGVVSDPIPCCGLLVLGGLSYELPSGLPPGSLSLWWWSSSTS